MHIKQVSVFKTIMKCEGDLSYAIHSVARLYPYRGLTTHCSISTDSLKPLKSISQY